MSTEHEQPAYQNYPAMPPAQAAPSTGAKTGVNGFAIAAFVLGVVGVVGGVLSVIFGIVALVDIRRTRQRGAGFAISGIVLSGVWLVAVLVFIGAAFFSGVRQAVDQQQSASSVGFRLKPGQCFDRDQNSQSSAVTVLDCAKPHDAEAFAVEPISASSYPGLSAVEEIGDRKCPADSDRYLTPGMNYPDFVVHYLYPEQQSWSRGDRTVICFYRRTDGYPITGHVKDVGLPYSDDQKRYLDAVTPYNKIVDEEYDVSAAGTWTEEKAVVARSVPVVQKEIDTLKAGPWPTIAQQSINDLVAEKQLELAARQKAAAAADEDSMDNALDDADTHDGSDQDRSIRTALHLPPR
jgi:hypothetical protein